MSGEKMWKKTYVWTGGRRHKTMPFFFTEEQNTNNFITWKGYVDLVSLAANSFAY